MVSQRRSVSPVTSADDTDVAAAHREIEEWTVDDVGVWAGQFGSSYADTFREHGIDGPTLLTMTEEDLRNPPMALTRLGDIKKIARGIAALRTTASREAAMQRYEADSRRAGRRYLRVFVAGCYFFLAIMATTVSLVVAHERVPATDHYPPLPDIILDNVPRLPWAFYASEYIAFSLGLIWSVMVVFHRARTAIITRFCVIGATVFLLRCVTMLATSLSVPGDHLNCEAMAFDNWGERLQRVWTIASGMGCTALGVYTCGDYMFSGHCSGITILACFICEYTPSRWRSFHHAVWFFAIVGIFCILFAHEHYSIDCFVGFYISSRVFGYYHALANQIAGMNREQMRRLGVWFPMIAFFEADAPIGGHKNVYEVPDFISALF